MVASDRIMYRRAASLVLLYFLLVPARACDGNKREDVTTTKASVVVKMMNVDVIVENFAVYVVSNEGTINPNHADDIDVVSNEGTININHADDIDYEDV